jgi:hypothetical protein
MSIKNRKSKRVIFGYFKSATLAESFIEHKRKHYHFREGTSYYVVKRKRPKAGQKSFLAYCLIPK